MLLAAQLRCVAAVKHLVSGRAFSREVYMKSKRDVSGRLSIAGNIGLHFGQMETGRLEKKAVTAEGERAASLFEKGVE